jgi:hypothetical protein
MPLPDFSDYFYRKIEDEGAISQAEHLSRLFEVIFEGCKFSESDNESQLCWVSRDLSTRAKKSIKLLAEFIELREKEESSA